MHAYNFWLLSVAPGEPVQGARIPDRALSREPPASAAERVPSSCADLADQLGDGELAARLSVADRLPGR
jgi:hypothetical protein